MGAQVGQTGRGRWTGKVGYSLVSATPRVSRSRRAPAGCWVRKTERAEASRRARERDGEHAAPACLILESEPLIRNPGSQSRARRRYKPFAGHGHDGRRPGLATRRRRVHSTHSRESRHVIPQANKSASTRSDTGRYLPVPYFALDRSSILVPGSSVVVFALLRDLLDHAGSYARQDRSRMKVHRESSDDFSSILGENRGISRIEEKRSKRIRYLASMFQTRHYDSIDCWKDWRGVECV